MKPTNSNGVSSIKLPGRTGINGGRTMTCQSTRVVVIICASVAILCAAASGFGLLAAGNTSYKEFLSPRGEAYRLAMSGVYAYSPEGLVAEGVGWDFFTLVFVVPVLIVLLPFMAMGSARIRVMIVGVLGYTFYQYLMYAIGWAFGPLFLVHVAIVSLSLIGLVLVVGSIDLVDLAEGIGPGFPIRGMATLSFSLAAGLTALWLSRIVTAYSSGVAGILEGQSTFVVQALDLGLMVPLAAMTGILALRRRPVGYLLSAAVIVKAVAMAGAICAMLIAEYLAGGTLDFVPLILFATVAATALWLAIRMYRNIPNGRVNGGTE